MELNDKLNNKIQEAGGRANLMLNKKDGSDDEDGSDSDDYNKKDSDDDFDSGSGQKK
jgi:hypothetical protein